MEALEAKKWNEIARERTREINRFRQEEDYQREHLKEEVDRTKRLADIEWRSVQEKIKRKAKQQIQNAQEEIKKKTQQQLEQSPSGKVKQEYSEKYSKAISDEKEEKKLEIELFRKKMKERVAASLNEVKVQMQQRESMEKERFMRMKRNKVNLSDPKEYKSMLNKDIKEQKNLLDEENYRRIKDTRKRYQIQENEKKEIMRMSSKVDGDLEDSIQEHFDERHYNLLKEEELRKDTETYYRLINEKYQYLKEICFSELDDKISMLKLRVESEKLKIELNKPPSAAEKRGDYITIADIEETKALPPRSPLRPISDISRSRTPSSCMFSAHPYSDASDFIDGTRIREAREFVQHELYKYQTKQGQLLKEFDKLASIKKQMSTLKDKTAMLDSPFRKWEENIENLEIQFNQIQEEQRSTKMVLEVLNRIKTNIKLHENAFVVKEKESLEQQILTDYHYIRGKIDTRRKGDTQQIRRKISWSGTSDMISAASPSRSEASSFYSKWGPIIKSGLGQQNLYLDECAHLKQAQPSAAMETIKRLGVALRDLKKLPKVPENTSVSFQRKPPSSENQELLDKHFQFLREVKKRLGQ